MDLIKLHHFIVLYDATAYHSEPAYSRPVPKPGNRKVCGRKGIWHNISGVAWLGLLSLSSVWLLQA